MTRLLAPALPFLLAAFAAWSFLDFFDLEGAADIGIAGAVIVVTGLLSLWNFGGFRDGSPSWDQIGRWVGRGIARVSYVALFGIPILASVYAAAETAPPPVFLMGYCSSLFYAVATTAHILRERFPRAIDPFVRWTGALSIHLGFLTLALLFQVQAADVLDAYAKPRRQVSLEPAREYLERLDLRTRETAREIEDSIETWKSLDGELVATCESIREASRTLDLEVRELGPASKGVQEAASSVHDLSERAMRTLDEIDRVLEKLRDRFRIFGGR